MANTIYPAGIRIQKQTVFIQWEDGSTTSATPSKGDKFSIDLGVLWALGKKFISTSKIVNAVFTATYFLGMSEGEMLWIVATRFLPEKTVEAVIDIAKKSK